MTIWQKLVAVFFFLAVVGLAGAGYYYYQYHKAQEALQLSSTANLQKSAQAEVNQLVSQVGKVNGFAARRESNGRNYYGYFQVQRSAVFCQKPKMATKS